MAAEDDRPASKLPGRDRLTPRAPERIDFQRCTRRIAQRGSLKPGQGDCVGELVVNDDFDACEVLRPLDLT